MYMLLVTDTVSLLQRFGRNMSRQNIRDIGDIPEFSSELAGRGRFVAGGLGRFVASVDKMDDMDDASL